jgi:hypothetical protein
MFRKALLSVVFLISTVACIAFAHAEPKVEFEGIYWITDLTAKAKVAKNNAGTDIDFEADLGLKDKNFPEGRFTWYIGPKSKVRLAYTPIGYSGDKNIERTIEFGGKTYTAGTRVITDLDVQYVRLGWAWQFVNISNGKIKFGTLLEAKGFWIDTSLETPEVVPPIKESEKFAIGLPTIGVALDINPHKVVNFSVEVSGMSAGKYGYFLDSEAGVKIIPVKNLSITGGYRMFDIKAKDEPDYAKLEISGPFVGATLRF